MSFEPGKIKLMRLFDEMNEIKQSRSSMSWFQKIWLLLACGAALNVSAYPVIGMRVADEVSSPHSGSGRA